MEFPAYQFREFPKALYHREQPFCLAQTPDDERRLYADGYRTTKALAEAVGLEPPPAPVPVPVVEPPPVAPLAATPPVATDSEDDGEAQRDGDLWSTPIERVLTAIAETDDLDGLARLRAREARNPRYPGGRKRILAAIDDRTTE